MSPPGGNTRGEALLFGETPPLLKGCLPPRGGHPFWGAPFLGRPLFLKTLFLGGGLLPPKTSEGPPLLLGPLWAPFWRTLFPPLLTPPVFPLAPLSRGSLTFGGGAGFHTPPRGDFLGFLKVPSNSLLQKGRKYSSKFPGPPFPKEVCPFRAPP